MLDEQVARQEEQNNRLKDQLDDLSGIREGMEALAAQQGEDYQAFVDKLNSNLDKNQKLLDDFAAENEKLRQNRRKIQIDSYIAMSNSFSMWDATAGLSRDEFQGYLSLLGAEFEAAMISKYGTDIDTIFTKLDTDGNGSLNIPEVKKLLNTVVTEEFEA
eukprot:TRINITY_DN68_c1_g1_i2.p2 TRINITY_DN68_c1_g1~~TRINITY_DN68_c1_g1_i2.p2  ORF type:complete len:160 (-),score=48.16 TRINITY_DN68_c1_g1_i2:10-489(-)